jgi:hypothetical protein
MSREKTAVNIPELGGTGKSQNGVLSLFRSSVEEREQDSPRRWLFSPSKIAH